MAEVRTFIQAEAKNLQQPGKILSTLNEFLHEDLSRAELFITMFYLSFDTDTGRLSFANAGHNPPMVWRSETKSFEWLDTEGLILGVKRDVVFEEKQFQMQPGDSLILYTDGITEAANSAGEMFGEGRLCALIEENHKLSPQQIINNLIKQVRSYSGTHILNDDVTLVILKVETSKAACR
jgi:serine phosphatase RsbU (regulator of sigma subunit)